MLVSSQRLVMLADVLLLCTPTVSAGVGRTFGAVCLFVCLFVCSITRKRMIPNCSNLV